ncbi:MAG: amidophosphoribosyltransferase [Deltaproteobacteria bacterium]|nr:MAG: amidophosphoribosyltransferase [Deltaproteobacteria bacterium]
MCGFVGMVGDRDVAPVLVVGLQAIQHRGQDAAGLGTKDGTRFHCVKDLGLIGQAIPPDAVPRMAGRAGIAHVRYPTAGSVSTAEDAQPFVTRRPGILLAHNGNVTNLPELADQLREQGTTVLSQCDAESILLVLAHELAALRPAGHTCDDLVSAVRRVFARVRGAYSVVAVLDVDGKESLVAFRDPHGIRPGVYGTDGAGQWMAASESVALDVTGFRKVDDLPPGEIVVMRSGEEPLRIPVAPASPRPCIFERIYFARPDSIMEDGRVNRMRWILGRAVARRWAAKGLEADVVVAVPDTSRPAAMAIAEELGIKNREGFIKNRYTGRTFIMPDAASRTAALRLKLNPIREIFEGRRVILVDDSIVRGTTMRRIVEMLRELHPAAIHLISFAPAVRHPCYYGIDMPSHDELVAAAWPKDEVEERLAAQLGVDSLTYLSLPALRKVAGDAICDACFSGEYVVPVSAEERAAILRDRRA